MAHDHRHHHHHHHDHTQAPGGQDWAELGEMLALEAEVLGPFLDEAIALLQRAGPNARHIIDVGCGPGVASVALARAFPAARVVALDRSPELLAMARARAAQAGVADRVATETGDLESLHGALRAADLIWAAMVLHHLEDLPRVLRELHASLAPEGLLAIAEFGPPTRMLPDDLGFGAPGFVPRFMDAIAAATEAHLPHGAMKLDWPALLTAAGFASVEQRTIHVDLPVPLDARARTWVRSRVLRGAKMFDETATPDDRATIAILTDPDDPRGVMQRNDVEIHAGRAFFVARRG